MRKLCRIVVLAIVVLIPASWALAVDSSQPDTLSLQDRVFIAGKIYCSVNLYFAHWANLHRYDRDKEYRAYLEKALSAADRRDFDLATMAFLSSLKNAHTDFDDEWIWNNSGGNVGILARVIDGKWVIRESIVPELKPGDVITAVDGESIDAFLKKRTMYVFRRTDELRKSRVFEREFLWPRVFRLSLDSGRTILIDRSKTDGWPERKVESKWIDSSAQIAYIRVPSFGDKSFEDAAVKAASTFKGAKALIVDVRGNGGGNTPTQLTEALMDRPFRSPREATPMRISVMEALRDLPKTFKSGDEYLRGEVDASSFGVSQIAFGGEESEPDNPVFKGQLILLVDSGCFSACEGFVMPFKDNHRAIIIGETTGGSNGQPYFHQLGNGMVFRIGAKRVSFPDGSEFEGVGIKPDVEASPSVADLKSGRDTVLERAIEIAKKP